MNHSENEPYLAPAIAVVALNNDSLLCESTKSIGMEGYTRYTGEIGSDF